MKNLCLFISVFLLTGVFGSELWSQESKVFSTEQMEFEHTVREKSIPLKSINSDCPSSPYRSVDGTCNNIQDDRMDWGATDIPLKRLLLPMYGSTDHYNSMGGENRPTARLVSNNISSQTEDTPSRSGLSSFVFTWGQFVDHDITLTPEGHVEYEPIVMPANESLFTSDIPFFRSEVYEDTGNGNYREQTNLISSYIDASNVYGSDQARADWLRTFKDGELKMSNGELLPYNTVDGEKDSTIDPDAPSMAGDGGGTAVTFVAGDVRASEQPGLTSLHTLFVRHHNKVAKKLKQQGVNSDEEIYQRARKEVGAIIQSITYNEFLPSLGISIRKQVDYRKNTQVDITNLFATAAYRLGHTMVTDELLLKDNACQDVDDGVVDLLEGFFNTGVVEEYNIDPILKGLSVQRQNEIDTKIVDELRNFLFGDPSSGQAFGLDLASLNIQRGRDHGLPDYNTVRRYFTGKAAKDFKDITRDKDLRDALEETYESVHDIDLWVGLLAEDKRGGDELGETLTRILSEQFTALKRGDRYFYTHDQYLSNQDRQRIDRTRLSDVIKENTTINNIQRDVFRAANCGHVDGDLENIDLRSATQLSDSALILYPNPAADIINLEIGLESKISDLMIVDTNGRSLQQLDFDASEAQIDISLLADGIYFIQYQQDGEIKTKRFSKMAH